MKKILAAGLLALSMNAFSQSYMVLQNGVVLTIDKSGFVYDLAVSAMPYNIEISGGQFMVENDKLITIDEKGYLYNKDKEIKKSLGKGLNYIFDEDKDLTVISADGTYVKYKFEDGKDLIKKENRYGGNFFIHTKDQKKGIADLYTTNSKGNYFKLTIPGLNPFKINSVGGNYFGYAGFVHTVNKDGIVNAKTMFKIPGITKKGGNFFVDTENKLWTVTEQGILSTPSLPANLNVSSIAKVGANYMLDAEGNLFTVDAVTGNVNQRTVPMHDLMNVKILAKPL